jgi:DNA-binding NtrC family response regulator
MTDLYQLIEKVAPTKANVLITGESGTGKEMVAKAIHHNGSRTAQPFIAVNCSALSESLLVSELFGYEKGAFTGAGASRAGRFELANKGTLFLDEIGEMGPSTQVTLLRVLQERTLERVGGGGKLIELDVRLITATNRDLKIEVEAKRFREDLFFRLNVVHIKMPPLRERMDDLPILIDHFLEKYGRDKETRTIINPETMRLLYAYHWPGNVRELENVIERGLVLSTGNEITPADLPEELQRPAAVLVSPQSVGLPGGPAGSLGQASTAAIGAAANAVTAATVSTGAETGSSGSSAEPSEVRTGQGSDSLSNPQSSGLDFVSRAIDLLPEKVGLEEALSAMEEAMARKAMSLGSGVQSKAADLLGLKRNVFKYKWDKYVGQNPTELSETLSAVTPDGGDLVDILATFEEGILKKALVMANGVPNKAADILGLKRNVLPYKLKKYPGLISFESN